MTLFSLGQTYNPVALSDFQKIMDSNPSNTLNWNLSDPGSLNGVTWEAINSHFEITKLNVSSANLSTLSLSEHLYLTEMFCYDNNLQDLDVSKLRYLKLLYCNQNNLTALDVSLNTSLTKLECDNNQLTSLDVTKDTSLTTLDVGTNLLSSLDLSKNKKISFLSCPKNKLTALDVKKLLRLTHLYCSVNEIQSLDVSANASLRILYCGTNSLVGIDVSNNISLQTLGCDKNSMGILDVSKNVNLTNLSCSENGLTELDVSKNIYLEQLDCSSNELSNLEVDMLYSLNTLYCKSNDLTSLNIVNKANFVSFDCSYNKMSFKGMESTVGMSGYVIPRVQDTLYSEQSGAVGQVIDYSDETPVNGKDVTFYWYQYSTEFANFFVESNTTGKYTPTKEGWYYAVRTHPDFSDVYEWQMISHLVKTPGSLNTLEGNLDEVSLFPNPTSDILNVKGASNQKVRILNIGGQIVKELQFSADKVHKVNVAALPTGIYFVELSSTGSGKGVKTTSFIKK
jgi:Leucine-rich repeat (LRR) protein